MKRVVFAVMMVFVLYNPVTGDDAYKAGPVSDGGIIKGTVVFNGAVPEPVTYKPTKDTEVCGPGVHTSDEISIGPNRGIQYAVVSLTDITGGAPLDRKASPRLDQKGCRFVPHVVPVPRGGTLEILNSDGILHNVRTTTKKNASFNKAQPKFMKKMKHKFTAGPEKIKVNCDAHSWMSAWIVVTDHPYYAVTDENGAFTLSDVPAGTYTIEYWHGSLGTNTAIVTVTAGETVVADGAFEGKDEG